MSNHLTREQYGITQRNGIMLEDEDGDFFRLPIDTYQNMMLCIDKYIRNPQKKERVVERLTERFFPEYMYMVREANAAREKLELQRIEELVRLAKEATLREENEVDVEEAENMYRCLNEIQKPLVEIHASDVEKPERSVPFGESSGDRMAEAMGAAWWSFVGQAVGLGQQKSESEGRSTDQVERDCVGDEYAEVDTALLKAKPDSHTKINEVFYEQTRKSYVVHDSEVRLYGSPRKPKVILTVVMQQGDQEKIYSVYMKRSVVKRNTYIVPSDWTKSKIGYITRARVTVYDENVEPVRVKLKMIFR